MLLPIDHYTSQLWHKAVSINQQAHYDHCDRKTFHRGLAPFLQYWVVNRTEPLLTSDKYMIVMANERDNKDPTNPSYFDWALIALNPLDLPESIRDEFPPSTDNIFKHGHKIMNGGLMRDSEDGHNWSSHT